MRDYIKAACEEIDAAMFTGDAFCGEEKKEHIKELRDYISRWERQMERNEKFDPSDLSPGLYRIFWKSGGSNPASVGITPKGDRWFAAVNWTSSTTSLAWGLVDSVELIERA